MSNSKDDKKIDPIEEALKLFAKARVFRDANRVCYVYTPIGDTVAIHGEEFESGLKAQFYRIHDRMLTDHEFNIVRLFFDPKCWPANPQVLSSELRRLEPDLRQRGIRIEFLRPTGTRRVIAIRRDACDEVTESESSASPSAS